jgi:hypothetical protein
MCRELRITHELIFAEQSPISQERSSMNSFWKNRIGLVAIALVIGVVLLLNTGRSAAQRGSGGAGHCTVVNTDGSHIIVVDNASNTLYFYAIDRDGKIGDELKLRGKVDLNDVGKPSLKPVDVHPVK